MTEFAKLDKENEILEFKNFSEKPSDPIGKDWRWLPVENKKPEFDSTTQRLVFDSYVTETKKVVRNYIVEVKEVSFDGIKEINDLKARVAALEAKGG